MIYQFKINLKNVGLPVWRRLQVESDTTFEEMHYIIMAAFEWAGFHMHEFEMRKSNGERIQNLRIGETEEENSDDLRNVLAPFGLSDEKYIEYGLPQLLNEENEKLSDWFKKEKDRAFYTYDFGDDWEHVLVLEKILEPDADTVYPLCTKAKNETPPEDSRLAVINNELDLYYPDWKTIVDSINQEYRTKNWKDNFLNRDDFI